MWNAKQRQMQYYFHINGPNITYNDDDGIGFPDYDSALTYAALLARELRDEALCVGGWVSIADMDQSIIQTVSISWPAVLLSGCRDQM
jgi:hypothetical protein